MHVIYFRAGPYMANCFHDLEPAGFELECNESYWIVPGTYTD